MTVQSIQTPGFREKLLYMIAAGNTAEALLALFEAGCDESIPLKAKLDSANAHLENHSIGLGEWTLEQQNINRSMIHLLDAMDNQKPVLTHQKLDEQHQPEPIMANRSLKKRVWSKIMKLFG